MSNLSLPKRPVSKCLVPSASLNNTQPRSEAKRERKLNPHRQITNCKNLFRAYRSGRVHREVKTIAAKSSIGCFCFPESSAARRTRSSELHWTKKGKKRGRVRQIEVRERGTGVEERMKDGELKVGRMNSGSPHELLYPSEQINT